MEEDNKSPPIEELITKYINSLNPIEKEALNIAKEQLESSFCLEKSIGFLEFKKEIQWWCPSPINKNKPIIPNIEPIIFLLVSFSPKK